MKKVKISRCAFAAIAAVFLVFGMLGALVQYLGPTLRAGEEELKQKPGESINASVPAPSVSAEGAVLIDADSGRVLYEKNADKRLYPASTTKIMTALIALETLEELGLGTDSKVIIPEEADQLFDLFSDKYEEVNRALEKAVSRWLDTLDKYPEGYEALLKVI